MNKNGGPDRRFSNNRELPICLYDQIHFTSPTGLNEIVQASRCGNAVAFKAAIYHLREQIAHACASPSADESRPKARVYRVAKDGQDLGEVPWLTIRDLIARGDLLLDDYYLEPERNEWAALRLIPELND